MKILTIVVADTTRTHIFTTDYASSPLFELNKHLTHHNVEEIREHLPIHLTH